MATPSTSSNHLAARLLALSLLAAVTLEIAAKTRPRTPESDQRRETGDGLVSTWLEPKICGHWNRELPPAWNQHEEDAWRRHSGDWSSRLVGGNRVVDGRTFPSYVEVIRNKFDKRTRSLLPKHVCGGVLLSDRVVLTAGNCFRDDLEDGPHVREQLYSVIPTHLSFSPYKKVDIEQPQSRVIRACIPKSYYDCVDKSDDEPPSRPWDVGLLILNFDDRVWPKTNATWACLPKRSYIDLDVNRTQHPLWQLGNGLQHWRGNRGRNIGPLRLKYFTNPRRVECGPEVLPRWPIACFEHSTTYELVNGSTVERFARVCPGDTGSPLLTVDSDGKQTVAGIIQTIGTRRNCKMGTDRRGSMYHVTDFWRLVNSLTFYEMLNNCTADIMAWTVQLDKFNFTSVQYH